MYLGYHVLAGSKFRFQSQYTAFSRKLENERLFCCPGGNQTIGKK